MNAREEKKVLYKLKKKEMSQRNAVRISRALKSNLICSPGRMGE